MSYDDLLRALSEEVTREVAEIRETAQRAREKKLAEARKAIAAEQQRARDELGKELDAARTRAMAAAALDQRRELLAEQRRLLAELEKEAREALLARSDPQLTAQLLEELLEELSDGTLEVTCDPGHEEACLALLRAKRPELAAIATIRADGQRRGGVEALTESIRLDNTLSARVSQAWPRLEAELAQLLFGGADGAL